MRHPHIVAVHDYGTDHGIPFYTMELLEGTDLSRLAPLPWKVACGYVRDAASGLSLLHARKLLHRDISPRNLWLTDSGAIKLIDFGALAAFGRAKDIVGTAPLVAREALEGQPLDQRTDLYALGALLYWLVTGNHAYPVRHLADLPRRWARGYTPASRALADLAREDLPPLPAELDALIDALLSHDARARPASAGEVYERLTMCAGLTQESVPGRRFAPALNTPMLVGRERERSHFLRALEESAQGSGRATVVVGESGMGGTRLLQELALEGRLRGAMVLSAQASACGGHLGLGEALIKQALEAAREQGQEVARSYAHLLAPLCKEMAELAPKLAPAEVPAAGEMTATLASAVVAFLCDLSQTKPLVLLVDNAERLGDGSAALLLALAAAAANARVVLVVTLEPRAMTHGNQRVRALRAYATKLSLSPSIPRRRGSSCVRSSAMCCT